MTTSLDRGILNIGLDLAMAWGEFWLQPIQGRLSATCPQLSPQQLDDYNTVCHDAMVYGQRLVYTLVERAGPDISTEGWRRDVLARFPWVNEENLTRMFSQGMYYTMK